ncbi:MAG: hypothetical protein LBS55_06690 [Prevotellaceae bacterium]|nr:hypothetical protein [Prevotellaceae bacterium]
MEALASGEIGSGGASNGYVTLTLNCYKVTISGIAQTGETYTTCAQGGFASCQPTSCN